MTETFALPAPVRAMVETSTGELNDARTSSDLRQSVSDRAATLAGAERAAEPIPEPLRPFVDKIAQHAYRITDEDFEALAQAGYSEDEVFELTISAALGASVARFERGLDALNEAGR